MKKYLIPLSIICAIIVALVLLFNLNKKSTIVIYDGNWNSLWLNNEIVAYIITHGYGYDVIHHGITDKEVTEGLAKGIIDIQMESWEMANAVIRNEHATMLEEKDIAFLGEIFKDSGDLLVIPEWVSKKYNIRTIEDMKTHWELFKNPDNPTKGVFYNGLDGWAITKLNEVVLKAYGLDKFYDFVKFSNTESEMKVFEDAQERKVPVFGYYFQPSYLMGKYKWHILEEPEYDKKIWDELDAAYKAGKPVTKACGKPGNRVIKYGSRSLVEDTPEVADMIRKMEIGLEPLQQCLIWGIDNKVKTQWRPAAIHYLKTYEDRWKTWVTPEAYEKIKESLKTE